MKKSIYFIIIFLALFWGCKKKDNSIEITPEPEPLDMVTAKAFLKGLQVTSATTITFDSASNSYLVNLPDNFNAKKAEVKLALQPNVFLADSLNHLVPDSVIYYSYIGTKPLNFKLVEKGGRYSFIFNVYFRFTGTPELALLENVILVSSWGAKIPLLIKGAVGSIPSGPDLAGIELKLTNKKTGALMEATISEINSKVGGFGNSYAFAADIPFSLEVKLPNQNPVTFDGIRFARGTPDVILNPPYKFKFTQNETIKISGGYFLPQEKYTMAFTNDFMAAPVAAQVTMQDSARLTVDKIPSELEEGSYLMSFYENGKLIGKDHLQISGDSTQAIETIWKGVVDGAVWRNTDRVVLNKGDEFYAKPWPLMYAHGDMVFDSKKLPTLHLESVGGTFDLIPELAVYHWMIAGIRVGFGKYKVPNDVSPGLYVVTGTYADGTKTKPYWCRIDVR